MNIKFHQQFIYWPARSIINTFCIVVALLIGTSQHLAAQTNIFAQLTGAPVNTTGWTLSGVATVGNVTGTGNSEVIVCPYVFQASQAGAIFYNQPLDLSICDKWIAEFDFRMYDGTQADGLAFCFLDAAPVGTQTGGGIGIPPAANGLKIAFDTYQNCSPDAVPKIEIRWGIGYNDVLYNNGECGSAFPTANNNTGTLSFLHSPTYNHAKITYNNGNIDVVVNGTLYLSGFQQLNFPGYLGFTASEGGITDNHSIKNVVIYADVAPSDAGVDQVICSGNSIQVGTANNPAYVYSWAPSAGVNNTTLSNPTITLTNNTAIPVTSKYYVKTAYSVSPGCTSKDSVLVTVKPASASNTNTTLCNSQLPYVWNGQSIIAAGTYIATLTGASGYGCDSVATVNITVVNCPAPCNPVNSLIINTGYDAVTGLALPVGQRDTNWVITAMSPGMLATPGAVPLGTASYVVPLDNAWATNPNSNWISCINTGANNSFTILNTLYAMTATRTFRTAVADNVTFDLHISGDNYIQSVSIDGGPNIIWWGVNYFHYVAFLPLTATIPLSAGYHTISVAIINQSDGSGGGDQFNSFGLNVWGSVNGSPGVNTFAGPGSGVPRTSTTDVTLCSNLLPYLWNGKSYSAAGSYKDTLVTATSCDSVATLNLTVIICPPADPCNDSYSWVNWNNFTGNSAIGTAIFNGLPVTVSMASGISFNSTPTMQDYGNQPGNPGFTLYPGYPASLPLNTLSPAMVWGNTTTTACFSESVKNPILLLSSLGDPLTPITLSFSTPYTIVYDGGGMSFTSSTSVTGAGGNAIIMFTGEVNCVTITSTGTENRTDLTWGLRPPINITGNLAGCSNVILTASQQGAVTYSWSGGSSPASATNTFITSGNYQLTVMDNHGCISDTTVAVAVDYPTVSVTDIVICAKDLPYSWNGISYAAAGTFIFHSTNAVGCDSAATLNLMVNPVVVSTTIITICSSELPYLWNGTSWAAAGMHNVTLVSAKGCDSVVTLDLRVNPVVTSSTTRFACSNHLPYVWNGQNYNVTGSYNLVFKSALGCDSIAILNLIINPVVESITDAVTCSNHLPYVWNGQSYNATGSYSVTFVSAAGCDSVATLNLKVNPVIISTTPFAVCYDKLPYVWNGNSYGVEGNYSVTLVSAAGCDSIAKLKLTIVKRPAPNLGPDLQLCKGDSLSITPATSFLSYLWNDGSTDNHLIVTQPGYYSVTVTNNCGVNQDDIIVVNKECKEYFPTAFTPNGDGLNDNFKILNGIRVKDYLLLVYNRWGEIVYQSNDYSKGWDGTFNGKRQASAVFVYLCTYKKSGETRMLKGTVALIR